MGKNPVGIKWTWRKASNKLSMLLLTNYLILDFNFNYQSIFIGFRGSARAWVHLSSFSIYGSASPIITIVSPRRKNSPSGSTSTSLSVEYILSWHCDRTAFIVWSRPRRKPLVISSVPTNIRPSAVTIWTYFSNRLTRGDPAFGSISFAFKRVIMLYSYN